MLINPLNSLPWTIGYIYQGSISFRRLKSFLDSKQSVQAQQQKSSRDTADIWRDFDLSLRFNCERITWPNSSGFELKDLRLSVKKGELVMVIGGISSGKSALLNAILGEMKSHSTNNQSRVVHGKIAYVSQSPWLQKNTIKVLENKFSSSFKS